MTQIMAVRGEFERIIKLGTSLEHAYNYFSDFSYVLPRLPEVDRIIRYRDGRYRMIFLADDGRGHAMGIVFDINHELAPSRHIKMISVPLSLEQLRSDKLMNAHSPLFPGEFQGEVLFQDKTSHVEVVYRAKLHIEIEVPRFLAFMPKNVLQGIGDALMRLKLHQVADGFANRVVADFGEWYTPYQEKRQRETEVQGSTTVEARVQNQTKAEVAPLINTVALPSTRPAGGLN